MTDEELDTIRARYVATTLGKWVSGPVTSEYEAIGTRIDGEWCDLLCSPNRVADAIFIAHAHEDVPALLDEIAWLHLTVEDLEYGEDA